jgi:hypothetical protein
MARLFVEYDKTSAETASCRLWVNRVGRAMARHDPLPPITEGAHATPGAPMCPRGEQRRRWSIRCAGLVSAPAGLRGPPALPRVRLGLPLASSVRVGSRRINERLRTARSVRCSPLLPACSKEINGSSVANPLAQIDPRGHFATASKAAAAARHAIAVRRLPAPLCPVLKVLRPPGTASLSAVDDPKRPSQTSNSDAT